jgi:aconitate hydratase
MVDTTFDVRQTLETSASSYTFYSLDMLNQYGYAQLARLPCSIRILLENALRTGHAQDVPSLANWQPQDSARPSLRFFPGRVLLQDFTGIPVLNDLAAMRAALARLGKDPQQINPLIPVDLVIDHSLQVDFAGIPGAMLRNGEIEFQRNRERYEFLHWAQQSFHNLRVVPPATGIVHQVNIEYLAQGVLTRQIGGETLAFPDTVIGTDSHTTMVNGLGVLGWGVGGIEAVAAMLDQPVDMLIPDVVGFKLNGSLPEGATPTDLTLTIVQMLRKKGVVDKIVEFYGPGLDALPVPDRAMVSNMAPEYGATAGFFPVDDQTLAYLRLTGRPPELIELVEMYYKTQGLFRSGATPDPQYSDTLELDLGSIEPSLAGPKRPQDRVALKNMQSTFRQALAKPRPENGYGVPEAERQTVVQFRLHGQLVELRHGSVLIAAITSCTNTSNPFVMLSAGLLAKKAVEKGLQVPPYVKTSLAPGSRVVTGYLQQAGLLEPLAVLGFNLVGYGCTTCIGNTGPLAPEIAQAVTDAHLVAAAVLSGNRNFEGRISPHTLANYLASPPLVVAFALAGTVDLDLARDPLGKGKDGQPVYLSDIWPTSQEVLEAVQQNVQPVLFAASYAAVYNGNPTWNAIPASGSSLYTWQPASNYLKEPPFFAGFSSNLPAVSQVRGGRVLLVLGDSVTTDHISPAGEIDPHSAAGQYLLDQGVSAGDFNSFGARRGNHQVMLRGTFGNPRLKNRLLPGVEGSFTLHLPDGQQMYIYEAALRYQAEGVPLLVLAGKEYGTGSSRDWAAKGPLLLGVRAAIAESFERIHRSNLAGMGVLPLQFLPGQNVQGLGLSGREVFDITGLDQLSPGCQLSVRAESDPRSAEGEDGRETFFQVLCRLDTALEVEYYYHGGILHKVLRELAANACECL